MNKKYNCVDVGRLGCPCYLLPAGECPLCSRFREGDCNSCNWLGVCPFSRRMEDGKIFLQRKYIKGEIIEKRSYGDKLLVFVIGADKGFCQSAGAVGSFLFCRCTCDELWYDVPISVLKSEPEKRRIHIAINPCGVKSMRLSTEEKEFNIRGVYHSGLMGKSSLKRGLSRTDVFCKGIAMAPLRNMLDDNKFAMAFLNNIHIYVDLHKIDLEFLKDYFGDLPIANLEIVDMNELEVKEAPDGNIIALTSPYFAKKIEKIVGRKIMHPNYGTLCCGEGICGGCSFDDKEGETVHLCKMYLD